MIIRVALFISLVALFYNYCDDGNSINKSRQPNDLNMIDVPAELIPQHNFDSSLEASLLRDSSVSYISAHALSNDFSFPFQNDITTN